jgi:[ribosomal protein S5]-alanine N-acetyltransferase
MNEVVSERLQFRLLREKDVTSRYVGWLNDPDVNRFLETRFVQQTLDSCREYVSKVETDPLSHLFGIFDKKTLEHIGNIKIGFINEHHKSAQLSLFIGEKSYWGNGYATESIRRITVWGFDELELERIEAGCYDNNVGSLRAFLKVGYSVEGYFRGSLVSGDRRIGGFWMGMLRTDRIA